MKKEVKKLLAYLLALAIVLTSVFTGQIVTKTTVKAATLENEGQRLRQSRRHLSKSRQMQRDRPSIP